MFWGCMAAAGQHQSCWASCPLHAQGGHLPLAKLQLLVVVAPGVVAARRRVQSKAACCWRQRC